jgi:hypothetical protein
VNFPNEWSRRLRSNSSINHITQKASEYAHMHSQHFPDAVSVSEILKESVATQFSSSPTFYFVAS